MGGLSVAGATTALGALSVLVIVVTLVARRILTATHGGQRTDLVLYQVAMLAGGAPRVADTALAYLTWAGMIEIRESTDRLVRVVGRSTVPDLHPVEVAALGAIDPAGVRPEAAIASARDAARSHVEDLDGLLIGETARTVLNVVAVGGSLAVAAAAVWWMLRTPGSDDGLVPLIAVVAVLYAGWWAVAGRPRLTRTGRETLEGIRLAYDGDLQVAAIGVTSLPLERAMHVIALYGRDALTGGLSALRKVLTGNPAPTLVMRSSLSR